MKKETEQKVLRFPSFSLFIEQNCRPALLSNIERRLKSCLRMQPSVTWSFPRTLVARASRRRLGKMGAILYSLAPEDENPRSIIRTPGFPLISYALSVQMQLSPHWAAFARASTLGAWAVPIGETSKRETSLSVLSVPFLLLRRIESTAIFLSLSRHRLPCR